MAEAFLCDGVRTPIGRYGGALSALRTDDLAALPIKALMQRHPDLDWKALDDIVYGCANQAGEDNRNVARMAGLLAGLPVEVPGCTVNRLCGSGMDAVNIAARAIKAGEAELMIAGGVESMTRAPFVMGKADSAFSRSAQVFDTTIGWRFVNKLMKEKYGVDSMPETADNVAAEFKVSREDQDKFALRSQQRWHRAKEAGKLREEIVPVAIPQKKGEATMFDTDEHPRPDTTLEALAKLKGINAPELSVTASSTTRRSGGGSPTRASRRCSLSSRWARPERTSPSAGASHARSRTPSPSARSSAGPPRAKPGGSPTRSSRWTMSRPTSTLGPRRHPTRSPGSSRHSGRAAR
jgi:acetyl-CoA acetyltransferase family protein